MQPPVADKRPVTSEHHGRTRVDDYDWLRAKDSAEKKPDPKKPAPHKPEPKKPAKAKKPH